MSDTEARPEPHPETHPEAPPAPRLVLGPFNRVEGDLELQLEAEAGRVTAARVNAPLYRGFERMLAGRDPSDALTLTPRICGICSISQSIAAARALGAAMGLAPTAQGAALAALIHAVENAADHLTHFNLFFMPDFTRPAYAGRPWHARACTRFAAFEGAAQRAALEARASLMHILGLLAGKWPHTLAVQPGGVTRTPGPRDKLRIQTTLRGFRRYLEEVVFGAPIEDFVALQEPAQLMRWGRGDAGFFLEIAADLGLAEMGRGAGRYLSFGAYPLAEGHGFAPGVWLAGRSVPLDAETITEDLSHAWMLGETAHPFAGVTHPDATMRAGAYSWCKAPRLAGAPVEVGALARQVIDGHPLALALVGASGAGGACWHGWRRGFWNWRARRFSWRRLPRESTLPRGFFCTARCPSRPRGRGWSRRRAARLAIGCASRAGGLPLTRSSPPPPGTSRRATRPASPARWKPRWWAPPSPRARKRR